MKTTLIQPFSENTFGEFLIEAFSGKYGEFNLFMAAIAFVKISGLNHIINSINEFLKKGNSCKFVIGIDQLGTSYDALKLLLDILGDAQDIFINHDENQFVTFHPKIYYFENRQNGLLIIGSGNLTQGGLFSNEEGFSIVELDFSIDKDVNCMTEIHKVFDDWSNCSFDNIKLLDVKLLNELLSGGYVKNEKHLALIRQQEKQVNGNIKTEEKIFGFGKIRKKIPKVLSKKIVTIDKKREVLIYNIFLMTLMRTDVGKGQVTPGKSRRSPEIFIPLSARDYNPAFWDWPEFFIEDDSRKGKFDRHDVPMIIGGQLINVNMMTWPVKHDFRLRSEVLRSAGDVGDILRLEKVIDKEYKYYIEIIPKDTSDYEYYASLCINSTRNSEKKWGYC